MEMKKLISLVLTVSLALGVFACSKKDPDEKPTETEFERVTTTGIPVKRYDETPDSLLDRANKEFDGNIWQDNCKMSVKCSSEEFLSLVKSYLGGEYYEKEEGAYADFYSDVFELRCYPSPQSIDFIEARCTLVEYQTFHAELFFIFRKTETLKDTYGRDDRWRYYYDGDPGYVVDMVLDKTGKIAIETNADDIFVADMMGFNVTEDIIAASINNENLTVLPVPFLSDDGKGGKVTSIDVTDLNSNTKVYDIRMAQVVGEDLELLTERMIRHGFKLTERTEDKAVYTFKNVSIAFDLREFGTDNQVVGFHIYLNSEGEKEEPETMTLSVNDQKLNVVWEDNDAVKALREMAEAGPVTIKMSPYGGFEQVGPIGKDLPNNDKNMTSSPGDIFLYSGNQIVIFYGTNTWVYTRLGKIKDMSEKELADLLSGSDVTITISIG